MKKTIMSGILRIGNWKLCWTESERGLFVLRKHRSRGPKKSHIGSGDKALTGSSLGSWLQWDKLL